MEPTTSSSGGLGRPYAPPPFPFNFSQPPPHFYPYPPPDVNQSHPPPQFSLCGSFVSHYTREVSPHSTESGRLPSTILDDVSSVPPPITCVPKNHMCSFFDLSQPPPPYTPIIPDDIVVPQPMPPQEDSPSLITGQIAKLLNSPCLRQRTPSPFDPTAAFSSPSCQRPYFDNAYSLPPPPPTPEPFDNAYSVPLPHPSDSSSFLSNFPVASRLGEARLPSGSEEPQKQVNGTDSKTRRHSGFNHQPQSRDNRPRWNGAPGRGGISKFRWKVWPAAPPPSRSVDRKSGAEKVPDYSLPTYVSPQGAFEVQLTSNFYRRRQFIRELTNGNNAVPNRHSETVSVESRRTNSSGAAPAEHKPKPQTNGPSYIEPPDVKPPGEEDIPDRDLMPPPGGLSAMRVKYSGMPKELEDMLQASQCQLCMIRLNSMIQARMHYESRIHHKKVKQYMIRYCREQGIRLPPAFRSERKPVDLRRYQEATAGSVLHQNGTQNDAEELYCKICQVMFSSSLSAQQHYLGRNHARRIEMKPPLRTGFYNAESGRWQPTTDEEKTDEELLRPWPVTKPGVVRDINGFVVPVTVVGQLNPRRARYTCDACKISLNVGENFLVHICPHRYLANNRNANGRMCNGMVPGSRPGMLEDAVEEDTADPAFTPRNKGKAKRRRDKSGASTQSAASSEPSDDTTLPSPILETVPGMCMGSRDVDIGPTDPPNLHLLPLSKPTSNLA
ncbi:unnamed protein product [Cyprideis torosa]|uniref:Uncharacterized protein n=1 Tax=Cyprideis torosa TaxID=163714 RepID=A0A7R8ZIF3_9CRUS|nr:unnamed protein product [Cyprideis torosa]CAG0884678.1 unnamed protein product [Cyprideis torosa]